jgi:GNAT superfamily N-acetyltransferase
VSSNPIANLQRYPGPHRDLLWSFRQADDSPSQLDAYIDLGEVWVAQAPDSAVVGHLQVVPRSDAVWEVTNTAVVPAWRGQGVGRALLERAVGAARDNGVGTVVLATATADVGNLRFYQRCGFRMTHVVHDAFTPAHGYPPGLEVDGIPLLDQVWFELAT